MYLKDRLKQFLLLLFVLIGFYGFSQKKEKPKNAVDVAATPIISYNKSFRTQIGLMANAYYNVNRKDTISPVSMVGIMGSYFMNGTYFGGVFAKNYFKEDKWRTYALFFTGNVEFQTYINYPDIPFFDFEEDGTFVDYNTKFNYVELAGKRQIIKDLYLGAKMSYSYIVTTFASDFIPVETDKLMGLGFVSEFDNRDYIMNPKKGLNSKIETFSYLEAMGSSSQYHRIEMQFNKYFSLSDRALIMTRFFGVLSVGDVPFSGLNIVGRDDLRGYSNGKYRGNQVYNIQSEYRWNFYKRWGMVAFGGLAIATNDFKGDNYSGLLPAIGTGIRFNAIRSRNINVGMDVAVGKEDWGLYFRIGEAFTR